MVRANNHLNHLIRTSDYGLSISRASSLQKAIASCDEFGDGAIEAAIAECGKAAKNWGLIEHKLQQGKAKTDSVSSREFARKEQIERERQEYEDMRKQSTPCRDAKARG